MNRKAIWSSGISGQSRESLREHISTNTVIIGGGLTGILTAYYLQERGIACVVLEEKRLGSGETGHTTAKITSQHGVIYDRLIKEKGIGPAQNFADANQRAIEEYHALIKRREIDCDWRESAAYLYTKADLGALQREYEAAKRLNLPVELTETVEIPCVIGEALMIRGQACFHPLKFLREIASCVTVYEHTKAERVEKNRVFTDSGSVEAEHIVFACHYPFVDMHGHYFLRMHQERSYVIAVQPGKNQKMPENLYLGIDKEGMSFRSWKNQILIGGQGHRTGENRIGGHYMHLMRAAGMYWPGAKIKAAWSAQDCMTPDGVPYIGRYGKHRENWYVATGFRKWGMTSAMVAAMLISDMIAGIGNAWENVFSPQRDMPLSGIKEELKECGQAVKGLAGISGKSGKNVEKRCTHLGCKLTWNPDEGTYDCPCHGSRFDADGKRLEGPAQRDLTVE